MWLHRFTKFLLTHRFLTLAIVFAVTFVPVIGIIGIVIAALITLRKGILEGALLTIAATLPYIISFYFTEQDATTVPLVVWAAVGVAVLSNVLTWVFAVMLRRGASWSIIVQIAALLGVLVVSIIHLAYPNVVEWWAIQLQSYYKQAQSMTGLLKPPPVPTSETQLETINVTKQYATGLMTAAILFNGILQLIVARWWQSIIFSPGSLRRELQRIRLSNLAGVLFIISLVFCYLGNSVVLDIMPILCILFAVAGLSLIHYLFGQMKSSTTWFWLSILYLTLIFSLPASLFLVAFVALVDIWLDIRRRFKKNLSS